MGKSQSKIMHSISVNFSLLNKRGEARKDPAELSLMRVRSSSLESISTAMSVRIGDVKPHPLSQTRSCSVDDILNEDSSLTNQNTPSKSCDSHTCVVDRERYTSVDSVSSSYSSEGEGDSPKARGFTQSLPAEIERKISIGSKDTQRGAGLKERELDCFSDNFITTPQDTQTESHVDEETVSPSMSARSILRGHQISPAQQESSFHLPSIPDSLLQKLSPEEWSVFINFVCATLENSLHSSIDEKYRHSLLKENTATNQIDSTGHSENVTTKHVKISEDQRDSCTREGRRCMEMASQRQSGQDCEDLDDICDRKHSHCGDRPMSLPSLHGLRDNPELIERLQALSLRQEVEPEVEVGPQERRLRSKSQDDCYYHNCRHSGQQFQLSRNRGQRHRCTHRSTKRRRNMPRSPRERSGRVDVSLDDNCPGLPQNRVTRRSRHHHVYHQHTVCEQCLQERLENSANSSPTMSKRRSGKHRHVHSATGEVVMADVSKSAGEGEFSIDQQSFMTLQDMKRVTSDFLKGTNDLDESVIQDLKMQYLRGMEEQRRHTATTIITKGGHRSLRLDTIQPCLSRNRPRDKSSLRMAASSNKGVMSWGPLAFPTEPRTGQDSPRTDMAVINLDINSSAMSQPFVLSDPSSLKDLPNAVQRSECGGNLYLYNHHHVHHVIHHSQL